MRTGKTLTYQSTNQPTDMASCSEFNPLESHGLVKFNPFCSCGNFNPSGYDGNFDPSGSHGNYFNSFSPQHKTTTRNTGSRKGEDYMTSQHTLTLCTHSHTHTHTHTHTHPTGDADRERESGEMGQNDDSVEEVC